MKKYKYIIIIIVLITFFIFIVFYIKPISLPANTNKEDSVSETKYVLGCPFTDDISYTECMTNKANRDYDKEFGCPFKDNVSYTECMIKNLDKLSAIREWKQIKLENLKYPEIGTDLLSHLVEDSLKIKKWRENFENARDLKCNASVIFYYGSGSPSSVATCDIEEEISALEILDDNYYLVIMSYYNGNKGIVDFEPTEEDILKLMETNKTTREGCCGIW